ncbi:hypothetical protein BaRGS_00001825 [Batillaria attramentaria]|uniref:Protein-glucosylgalactosylhydroxylysine glucosidase n=1 Tax=Batillaria attramentaria TaxID=370345 RepID=A0ABD0M4Y0_9CAEN
MPEVGNGHVATVVMGNAVYMNGLYNGANVSSHRARIPSRAAVMATIISPASGWKTKYRMDFGRGVFSEIHTADDFTVMVNRYAHRELTRLLVTEVIVNRTVTSRPVTIAFTVNNGSESEDIDFQQKGQGMMSGKTREPEYPDMSPTTDVTVVYSEVLPNMTFDSIVQAYMPFFTSVSTSSSDAIDYFNKGMSRMANGTLYSSHVAAWDSVWQNGRIDLTGNTTMALSTYATLYYLLSSVPLKPDSQWPFVGMAPGGLAHGAAGKDYEGHVFWDQDTWMFPPIMLLHADIGRIIVGTRLRTHQAALKYANMTGYSGARYPWESAFTGLNVSPSVATTVYENHITGDTAWMMRQYLQQTNDTKFLTTDGGYQALSDIAKYWLSRVTFSKTTSLYEIRDVMGPDEWHSPVNNSAYTNVIAAQALYTAIDAASLIKQTPPDDWLKVAQNMYIPFDSEKNFHPEYDDYKTGTNVKQADTIMLGFPLEWPMSAEVRANDLKYYATVTPSGPAMTWGMFAANWLRVGRSNKVKADAAFYKGTYNIQDPFKVWSENADGTGAMNFHTGMGGYLQSLLFGYAGFDFNDQHLGLNPMLPPSLTQVSVTGFDYGGDSLDLSYDADHMNVTVTKHTGRPMVLQLLVDQTLHNLDLGVTVTAQCQPAYILRPVT